MIIIYALLAAFILCILALIAIVRTMCENKRTLKQLTDDHYKNVNDTLLVSDRISEEAMAVLDSERPFFGHYESLN
jgi:hypothetical protein